MEDFGFLGFIKFVAYYIIAKAFLQVYHLYARRNGKKTGAGVSGLLA